MSVKAIKWFLMIAMAVARLRIFAGDGEAVSYNTIRKPGQRLGGSHCLNEKSIQETDNGRESITDSFPTRLPWPVIQVGRSLPIMPMLPLSHCPSIQKGQKLSLEQQFLTSSSHRGWYMIQERTRLITIERNIPSHSCNKENCA